MKCPLKKISTVTIQYDEFNEIETRRTIKLDFGECSGSECPYFDIKTSYTVGGSYIEKATCRMVG